MNVLAIGNSFSQDATRYLAQIARVDSFRMNVVNLYIGGCSLDMHFRNIMADRKAYSAEINGFTSGFFVSVKDALLSREWDIITLQQVSGGSGKYESYQPYLDELAAYVRKYAPKAKLYIHQTWAYEDNSALLLSRYGYTDSKDMYNDLKKAYEMAAEAIGADGIIESGRLMQMLIENGIEKIHRDTFHLTLGAGRFAAGLLWYKVLTGNSIDSVAFDDFDELVSEKEIEIIKKCINEVI